MCPRVQYLEADDEREDKSLNEMDVQYVEVHSPPMVKSPHIWVQNRHFTHADETNPSADEVEEGQVFYNDAGGVTTIYEIVDIDRSVPTNKPGVTYEYIYTEDSEPGEVEYDAEQIPMDVITGLNSAELSDAPMGYTGPPTRLREVHFTE
jgi:hypothetical protein